LEIPRFFFAAGWPKMALRGFAVISLPQSEQNCRRLSRNHTPYVSSIKVAVESAKANTPLASLQAASCDETSCCAAHTIRGHGCAIASQSSFILRNRLLRHEFPDRGQGGGTVDLLAAETIMSGYGRLNAALQHPARKFQIDHGD
jgi:hypothetical protein